MSVGLGLRGLSYGLDSYLKMDPTSRFFNKLRKLAVTLESETARLQHTFDNRNKDDDDSGE